MKVLSVLFVICRCNGNSHRLNLKLPVMFSKFSEPAEMDSATFFARWKGLSQWVKECSKQKIFLALANAIKDYVCLSHYDLFLIRIQVYKGERLFSFRIHVNCVHVYFGVGWDCGMIFLRKMQMNCKTLLLTFTYTLWYLNCKGCKMKHSQTNRDYVSDRHSWKELIWNIFVIQTKSRVPEGV